METRFASPDRSDKEVIRNEYEKVDSVEYARQIMNAMPCLSVILNSNRQIVYANEALTSLLGIDGMLETLGLRPGELVSCIHSRIMPGGCGTADACRQCGAVNTILKCMETHRPEKGECLITSVLEGQLLSFEFKVNCSPFFLGDDCFVIMTLTDISGEKRRKLLERTFLHDLANQTGNLQGLAYMIRQADVNGELGELSNILSTVSSTINDEIVSYRQLISAENNMLPINISDVNARDAIDTVIRSARFHDVSRDKEIAVVPPIPDVTFRTDPALLQRVLLNMMKNALEVTPSSGIIDIGCDLRNNNAITFYVRNTGVIPDHVKTQIFQRSFSTKEEGRGIGTYSMKLFGERYLKGKVGFESDPESGTSFHITLPL